MLDGLHSVWQRRLGVRGSSPVVRSGCLEGALALDTIKDSGAPE